MKFSAIAEVATVYLIFFWAVPFFLSRIVYGGDWKAFLMSVLVVHGFSLAGFIPVACMEIHDRKKSKKSH